VYAWFLPDSVPSLTRRCVGQNVGDCTRIGPTEIIALTEREVKRSRIVGDWARRLFIGMWNSIPVVLGLFVLELIVMCLELRFGFAPNFPLNPVIENRRPKVERALLTNIHHPE